MSNHKVIKKAVSMYKATMKTTSNHKVTMKVASNYKVTMKVTSSYKVIMKATSQEKEITGKGKAIMKTTSQGKVMAMDMMLIKSKAVMVKVMWGARTGGWCRGRGKRYVIYGEYSLELICGIHLKSGYQQ